MEGSKRRLCRSCLLYTSDAADEEGAERGEGVEVFVGGAGDVAEVVVEEGGEAAGGRVEEEVVQIYGGMGFVLVMTQGWLVRSRV